MSSPHSNPENPAHSVLPSHARSATASVGDFADSVVRRSEASGEEPADVDPSMHSSSFPIDTTANATPSDNQGPGHASAPADIKKSRSFSAAPWQNGPSLLTQALASARGIPKQAPVQVSTLHKEAIATRQTSNDKSPGDESTPSLPDHDNNIWAPATASLDKPQITPAHHGDNRPVKPHPVQPLTMAAPTITATVPLPGRDASSVPSSLSHPSLSATRTMLWSHHDPIDLSMRRSSASFDIEREPYPQNKTGPYSYTTSPVESTTPTKSSYLTSTSFWEPPHSIDGDGIRPRPEHRGMVPSEKTEKIWSIGAGDGLEGDGLVEQSVAEAMAGVEPNARSRKASYSLRFFKEGLPQDDKSRRRDVKHATREKLPPTTEESIKGGHQLRDDLDDQQTHMTPTVTPQSTASLEIETDFDYFTIPRYDAKERTAPSSSTPTSLRSVVNEEFSEPPLMSPKRHVGPAPPIASDTESVEGRRQSGDSTEVGESPDDGDADESGEEKISSAVFVPHQELSEPRPRESISVPTSLIQGDRGAPQDDAHPWLVKADEPEPEIPEKDDIGGRLSRYRSRESLKSLARADITSEVPEDHIVDEEFDIGTQLSRVASKTGFQYEDHVHDHQHQVSQPLEAIELIPYKHQVGGHTTIWRFSRRAVCKQLNNRENEFYETIERYHRNLLAFLPRYIGVLNVTFQKQSRRKSTSKKDDAAGAERKKIKEGLAEEMKKMQLDANGRQGRSDPPVRIVSQSLASANMAIPTVTFDDNRHILPRNLLQPTPVSDHLRRRSISTSGPSHSLASGGARARPPMDDRPNSWGATTVNKRLRNEVFNDAFLKEPVQVYKHRPPHQRSIPRPTLNRLLRSTNSDPNMNKEFISTVSQNGNEDKPCSPAIPTLEQTQSDLGPQMDFLSIEQGRDTELKDVTGTSAPEPEIIRATPLVSRRKRRYSAGGLRRKPTDVQEPRGDLKYYEEADDAGYKGDHEDHSALDQGVEENTQVDAHTNGAGHPVNGVPTDDTDALIQEAIFDDLPSPGVEFRKIPRPINPKEAKTQRDRVEYFLLLEDLTAGMKRPCMMDLKMGTRQYGPDANLKKQKSQQEKCKTTTSAELGVRICGLQVWNAETQSYDFQDKYFGRRLKAGDEFKATLRNFLYNGHELQSILRHIPVVLRKLAQLEHIVQGLYGYRFYAASLLMFYDGDCSEEPADYDTAYDSLTDVATDTEDYPRYQKKNKGEIDFKIADFANSLTPYDRIKPTACPPHHPDKPDAGFLKGLRSLRRYFIQIQKDVRNELGVHPRKMADDAFYALETDDDADLEGMISM